jgi:hypothetical protein
MAIEPMEFRDPNAERRLLDLLQPAAAKLAQLGPEPVLVAQCPNKFNDVWYDDLWYAAQVGTAFWEAAHYIEQRPAPEISETGKDQDSTAVMAARQVLQALEAARWRDAAIACFGKEEGWQAGTLDDVVCEGDVLCLAMHYGQPWLCVVSSNDSTEIACTWTPKGLVHMARCERLDQYVGLSLPLRFRELRRDFAHHLQPEARGRILSHVRDSAAAASLCKLLQRAIARLDDLVPPDADSSSWLLKQEELAYTLDTGDGNLLILPLPDALSGGGSIDEGGNPALKSLATTVRRLEAGGWRQLFARAIGQANIERLDLLRRDDKPLLIRGLAAYEFMSGELRLAGLCNDAVNLETFELYDAT